MTYFARALGAAHLRQTAPIRESVDALQEIRDRLTAGARGLLGRAGRDSAAAARRRGWRRPRDGRAMRVAQMRDGRRARGRDREERHDARSARAGARAARRDAARQRRCAGALKEFEATMKKEPNRFRARGRRSQGGGSCRRARQGGRLLCRAAEDLRAGGCRRAARAGRSPQFQCGWTAKAYSDRSAIDGFDDRRPSRRNRVRQRRDRQQRRRSR